MLFTNSRARSELLVSACVEANVNRRTNDDVMQAASKATSRDSRDTSFYSLCDDDHDEDDDVQGM